MTLEEKRRYIRYLKEHGMYTQYYFDRIKNISTNCGTTVAFLFANITLDTMVYITTDTTMSREIMLQSIKYS